MDSHCTDRGRAARLAPRPGSKIAGGQASDPLGGNGGPTGGVDLARLDQSLGACEQGREGDLGIDPAIVVLAAGLHLRPIEAQLPDAGQQRDPKQFGQFRRDLTRLGVDRVPTGEDEVERADEAQGGGQSPGGGQGVGSGEGGVADEDPVDVDAPIQAPGDRFPEGVFRGRRPESHHRHGRVSGLARP